MCDVVVRHSEDGYLGDGATASFNATSSFIDGGQIRVHVPWVGTTTGYFFSSCRNFTESVAVGGEIGENYEDMLFELVGIVFRGREGQSWCYDTLNGRVVGQIQEQGDSFHRTIFLKISYEEARRF